ncbi:MAG: SURF1 family protein [Actinomycetota bacterium]|nr:SURF1 family protein [Actinomycetota bacterium]
MTNPDRSFRFLRTGKWIMGHILALVAILVFVNMGLWQLRRLDDRQDFNQLLTDRSTTEPQPLDEALAQYGPDQDNLELRRVHASGTYLVADEVILFARSFEGLSGSHVLTPLDLGDGRVLIVDRGWVPIDLDQPGAAETEPPAGIVGVSGVLRKTEVRGSFGPVDPEEGTLDRIARVNLDRLDRQIDGDVVDVYVQLQEQEPAQPTSLPEIVALPTPSEGSHRAYAVQWFLFAAVTAVGYPILLWRTAEGHADPPAG